MSLVTVIITLLVVGILLYLVNQFVPMDARIKRILNWVVVICVILWLLSGMGVWDRVDDINLPKV